MRILILGGYGHFGGRIARSLAADPGAEILVAGRDAGRARDFIAACGVGRGRMRAVQLDIGSDGIEQTLRALSPALVIHSAGPFQGRDYRVARAALACGSHYIDLADGRAFVAGIDALDELAKSSQRWAIGGASSVPGLSAAVIESLRGRFSRLDSVDVGISPGNRTPRGLATTQAILGYVGQPYTALLDGRWRTVHGWQSLRRVVYPGVAARWLVRCEVPDLDILPCRYPQLQTCEFRAGLDLRRMHFGLWLGSWLVRAGAIRSLQPWAGRLLAVSERWLDSGSDIGTMHVELRGVDADGAPVRLRWTLLARDGDGPQVPCTAAIVLARKLARGQLPGSGARPCLDLFTLEEFLQALDGYAIETSLQVLPSRHPRLPRFM